ncbi:adenylate/guanylate cyclase with Chase sensor [[Leptolyngbya] sp. PCC 7376]|uniref:CHASE2 domain-containing protein n=1 Tax=[Leptolyngbya] sp. PCC 7376 TaxID=111781 RepID=UPI00029EF1BE|nr:adenylate/guanylate cyclase domain-containing protein [[Leptolyngbya] sp. PCC 7376]AFY37795.1 adenylate/guanylate cyclase with Chase sensor [[Leptolyngbya] sp. PCC 7376]
MNLQVKPWAWLGGIIGVSCAALWQFGAWETLERSAYNTLVRSQDLPIFPEQQWDDRVVVIAIDEPSIETYGRFPWERSYYTDLLTNLSFAPPAAIGFDVIFSEPTEYDAAFAEEMMFGGNVAIAQAIRKNLEPIEVLPAFTEVTKLGHIVARPDPDSIIREGISYIGDFPSLSVAMLEIYRDTLDLTISAPEEELEGIFFDLPNPIAAGKEKLHTLNWKRPSADFPTYSFSDVASGNLDPEIFANKLVLIGITATGFDPLQTPFELTPPSSAVYLHAVMLDNFLTDSFLRRSPQWLTLSGLLLLAPTAMFVLTPLNLRGRLFVLALTFGGWWGICLLSLGYGQWLLPAIAPIGTILLSGMALQFYEQYEKQELMNLFARHVSPEMAEVIWQRKEEIFTKGQLEPQELTATVLFSDIRGFTKISEHFPPNELLPWLNDYLHEMTQCIVSHGGIVDKYIGDGIMAVFGVPFARETEAEIQKDAIQAIASSLEMHKKLKPLNKSLAAKGLPQIEIGVGIHTGKVVAGTVGGQERLSYSVVGDTVNTSSRLESLNKKISEKRSRPYNIVLSAATFDLIQSHYNTDALGKMPIRGRNEPMTLYTVTSPRNQA